MTPLEAAVHAQSTATLSALDDYLRAAPGREIRISHDFEQGFRVALHEGHISRGENLRDAAAQICTTLMMEAP